MITQPPTNNNDELRDSILKLFGAYLTNGHWNIEPVEVAEKIVQSCHHYAQKMVLAELKDIRPGRDSDVTHLQKIIDDRITTLEKELKHEPIYNVAGNSEILGEI